MKASIPRVILYRIGRDKAEKNLYVILSDERRAWCLFSDLSRAVQYRADWLWAETGWEFGPMDDNEFRQFLASFGDSDLIVRDPQPSDKDCYCIEVSRLRDLVARGENDAEFELHAVAGS